ncbi:thioredoxin family protein [Tenacibaculum sp. 190524A05c]|uniref:Thioredoxin domain-containing protein n=1 Tax=Tenacibaculum platacis TaxID=3137852 RepID=A0ABP1EWT8_9FLAO
MKHFLLSTILFFTISSVFAQEKIRINWQPTLQDAIEKSKDENKLILVYFTGSDWCGPCINLDKNLFHTEKFRKFSEEHLVLYMADFPRNKDLVSKENRKINKQLSEKYGQSSFPTILLIDNTGTEYGRKNGSYLPEYYFPFFEEMVNQFK